MRDQSQSAEGIAEASGPITDAVEESPRILVVDDDRAIARSAKKWLQKDGHRCTAVGGADEARRELERGNFDVVVTDVNMPEESGLELLKRIRERDDDTQVIVMTAHANVDFAIEAVKLRADDYLLKPFELAQLSHAVARAVEHRRLLRETREYRSQLEYKVREQARHIERLFLDGLQALSAAVEMRDQYTGEHLDRVTQYAIATGSELSLDDQKSWSLWLASLFHDVGKLAIPDGVLNKTGPLSDEEFEMMRKHPELGVAVIDRVTFLRPAIPGVLHHQERWDGQGYPQGLRGEEISIEGRVLAVSDAFDAMRTDRPYRRALSETDALAELRRCSGKQFDPDVVEAFLNAREKNFPARLPDSSYTEIIRTLGLDSLIDNAEHVGANPAGSLLQDESPLTRGC